MTMARKLLKPFSRTEMRILIYNKVKKGLSYEEAKREVQKEIEHLLKNNKKMREKEKKKDKRKTFKEEFAKLQNGK